MNKKNFILLLVVFGFLLTSNTTFACENHSQKSSCKKEMSSKKEMKDCCGNSKDSKEKKNCNGKCGHSNCTISVVYAATIPYLFNKIQSENDFLFSENTNFSYLKTNLSSGFYSIWLIPKIG